MTWTESSRQQSSEHTGGFSASQGKSSRAILPNRKQNIRWLKMIKYNTCDFVCNFRKTTEWVSDPKLLNGSVFVCLSPVQQGGHLQGGHPKHSVKSPDTEPTLS